ncbi:MAG: hypothetical protein WCX60_02225, partial [Anaerovoracaceae bacterium]
MKDTKTRGVAVRAKNRNKGNRNGKYVHKALIMLLALLLLAGLPVVPGGENQVWAAEDVQVKIEQTGGYFATQGDQNVPLKVRVTNNGKARITFHPTQD